RQRTEEWRRRYQRYEKAFSYNMCPITRTAPRRDSGAYIWGEDDWPHKMYIRGSPEWRKITLKEGKEEMGGSPHLTGALWTSFWWKDLLFYPSGILYCVTYTVPSIHIWGAEQQASWGQDKEAAPTLCLL
ncbi:hypothetical protein NDU88_005204, partial [Pleurodeles waltl]